MNRFWIGIAAVGVFLFLYFTRVQEDYRWMEKSIQKELSFVSKVTSQEIDEAERLIAATRNMFMRVKIQKGALSYTTSSLNRICQDRVDGYLKLFEKWDQLPDLDCIIVLEDGFDSAFLGENPAPVFCISKSKNQNKVLRIPEIHASRNVDDSQNPVHLAGSKFPWKKRVEKAFWRGGTTGAYNTPENWMNTLRAKLVIFSKSVPEYLDCAFSGFVQGVPEAEGIMRERGLFGNSCSRRKQLKFKYLLAADGNTCASSLKWQLFSGSVVLRNESNWGEWFDSALVPFEHYIPYKADFSDLVEKIEWLKKNDRMARKIAKKAERFAENSLTSKSIEIYSHKLLLAYSKKLSTN